MLTRRLDVFGPDLAHSLLLQQRPPLQPGKSGSSHYTVAPHQVTESCLGRPVVMTACQ
jgi:hypothetical protein